MCMDSYLARLMVEREEVSVRYNALLSFIRGDVFLELDGINRGLLEIQEAAMRTYVDTLDLRINVAEDVEAVYD